MYWLLELGEWGGELLDMGIPMHFGIVSQNLFGFYFCMNSAVHIDFEFVSLCRNVDGSF